MTIKNPILPGFHPDPSICRVGDDYYVATSTFEWYPGVRIYHSRDLKHWRLVATPLDRAALLDMRGNPDSCGVWAPCLSYADGRFFLVYTDTKRFDGHFKDTHNYLTTCDRIDGEWSDPIHLNSSGFDPSLFHDDDGRKWLLNMVWDHRPGRSPFRGIVLQEFRLEEACCAGEPTLIFEGTELGCTEGPHLYRLNGYYYLLTAEGGTGYRHAVTLARSRSLHGPFEVDPLGPILTAAGDPAWPLQRAGHGDIVETPAGDLMLVHLCSRPLPELEAPRSPLGRETALQRLRPTDDGWIRLADDGVLPATEVSVATPTFALGAPEALEHDDFDAPALDPEYQWLRTPYPQEFMSLSDRPGHLRLYGMESIGSAFRQALVARRQTAFSFELDTVLDFEPTGFQQLAGLVCYYNASKFHYLYVSSDSELGRHLGVMSCEGRPSLELTWRDYPRRVPLPRHGPIFLGADVREAELVFRWSIDGEDWRSLLPTLDYSLLCDEVGKGEGASFTGTFVGVCCQDLSGRRRHADFDFLRYRPWL